MRKLVLLNSFTSSSPQTVADTSMCSIVFLVLQSLVFMEVEVDFGSDLWLLLLWWRLGLFFGLLWLVRDCFRYCPRRLVSALLL